MRVVFYMNVVSPHQLPIAHEIVNNVGQENFTYVYIHNEDKDHSGLKFNLEKPRWIRFIDDEGAKEALESADLLFSGLRDWDIFERRCQKGLRTYYTSERWFKPRIGRLRMLVPGFRTMAKRFLELTRYDCFKVLPIGVHAENDFLWLGVPAAKMTRWGYFVSPSTHLSLRRSCSSPLKVLWVGRRLPWKRVDTIERAVAYLQSQGVSISLDIFTNLSLDEVRSEMRAHDVYVFASNGYEGWGAVVSEALEEGMRVLGTFEAGASATLLPRERLFHAGDWRSLVELLKKEMRNELPSCSIGEWTAKCAAAKLFVV